MYDNLIVKVCTFELNKCDLYTKMIFTNPNVKTDTLELSNAQKCKIFLELIQ